MEMPLCLIAVVLLNGIAADRECSYGCEEEKCYENGTCTVGCHRGYTGNQCDTCLTGWYAWQDQYCLDCSDECVSCNTYYECTSCETGFYGIDCKSQCSRGCIKHTCEIYGRCKYGCLPGYYGQMCIPCPNGCLRGNCSNPDGECSCHSGFTGCEECRKGWYQIDNTCAPCDFFCESCSAPGTCQSCSTGYGNRCSYACHLGCIDGKCQQEDGSCIKGCNPSYYGSKCYKCSRGCLHGQCNVTDGSCKCQIGYNGTKCDTCLPGWYMKNVNCVKCPGNCGSCSDFSHLISCQSCKLGYYGYKCYNVCSPGCKFDACNLNDGSCTYGCKSGYYKSTFNKENNVTGGTCTNTNDYAGAQRENCHKGWYKNGDRCLPCSFGCLNRVCEIGNGTCDCINGFTGTKCDNCTIGWYKNNGFCVKYHKNTESLVTTVGISVAVVFAVIIMTIVIGAILVRKRLRQLEKAHAQQTKAVELSQTGASHNNHQHKCLRTKNGQEPYRTGQSLFSDDADI